MNASQSDSTTWTHALLDLLCSLHIPVLKEYNKFGKTEKEAVSTSPTIFSTTITTEMFI